MKNLKSILFMTIVMISLNSINAQGKYLDKKGTIFFEASEKTFEPIKAKNESVTVILNAETNEIASLALMKSFRFKNSLMEEHFNENYIESETYPKATFRGKLLNFNFEDLDDNINEVTVEGTLKLRNKEKKINSIFQISKIDDTIVLKGAFMVTAEDFDIDIPSIVEKKISDKIKISLDFNLIKR